jgi:adenosylhomocysteinase
MNAYAEKIRDFLSSYYTPEEWPTLLWQAEEWSQSRPLEGLRVLDGTPLYRNTLGKFMALLAAGAEVWVPERPGMPYDAAIMQMLPEFGIRKAPRSMDDFDMVLDCSGQFCELHPRLGFAELTRTGVHRYVHPHHPVILADSGRIKRIETVLGTGESFFRALAQLGHTDLAGKPLLIVGFGKVGRGVLYYALKNKMRVCVADVVDKSTELPGNVAFIDANHTYEATLTYFNALASRVHEKSVVVVDDIHYNEDMEKAWKAICADERVTTTMDLYRMGLVFFDKHYWRKHYKMRI